MSRPWGPYHKIRTNPAYAGIIPPAPGILRKAQTGEGIPMITAFIRTIILYLVLMAGIRLMGKRQIG